MRELADTNIRHFKLSSGEEVIAVVQGKSNDNMLVLEHPMRVHTALTETGIKFMFTTWQPMAKDDICQINPLHIISHVECTDDIKERYVRMCIEMTDSGDDDTTADESDTDDDGFDEHFSNIVSQSDKDGPTFH